MHAYVLPPTNLPVYVPRRLQRQTSANNTDMSSSTKETPLQSGTAAVQPHSHHVWDNLIHHRHQAKPDQGASEHVASEYEQRVKASSCAYDSQLLLV